MRLCLYCLSLVLLVSCGSPSSSSESHANRLRVALAAEPDSFDPREAREISAQVFHKALYEGLTRLDSSGEPLLGIANAINVSPDGLTYTFQLRPSLWSDGTPVTSHQFKAAWLGVLSPEGTSEYAFLFYPIKNGEKAYRGEVESDSVGLATPDEQTLVVTLEYPVPYFTKLVAAPAFSPLSPSLDPDTYVSNGPFYLQAYQAGSQLDLRKNSNYWDSKSVKLEELVFPILPDVSTATGMYELNQIEWVGSPILALPTEVLSTMTEADGLSHYACAATYWYKFNTLCPPLDHPKIRKALAYAIQRDDIIKHVAHASHLPAVGPVPPTLIPGWQGSQLSHKEKAQALFQEALDELGCSVDDLPPLTILSGPLGPYKQINQAIQQQWRETLGLKVNIEQGEAKVIFSRIAHLDYTIAGKVWIADFGDAVNFLDHYQQPDTPAHPGTNQTGWGNPEYTKCMELAEVETNPSKRTDLFRAAVDIFMEEMPVAPIYHPTFTYLQKPYVTGVVLPPVGPVDFKSASVQ